MAVGNLAKIYLDKVDNLRLKLYPNHNKFTVSHLILWLCRVWVGEKAIVMICVSTQSICPNQSSHLDCSDLWGGTKSLLEEPTIKYAQPALNTKHYLKRTLLEHCLNIAWRVATIKYAKLTQNIILTLQTSNMHSRQPTKNITWRLQSNTNQWAHVFFNFMTWALFEGQSWGLFDCFPCVILKLAWCTPKAAKLYLSILQNVSDQIASWICQNWGSFDCWPYVTSKLAKCTSQVASGHTVLEWANKVNYKHKLKDKNKDKDKNTDKDKEKSADKDKNTDKDKDKLPVDTGVFALTHFSYEYKYTYL